MALKIENGSNKKKGLCKIAIDEDMTIYGIETLKTALSEKIVGYERFEMNLSTVEEIDSSGIQLLLALQTELKQKNKTLQLIAASSAVTTLMEAYGLGESFNNEGAS